MNAQHFLEWFETQLMPNIPPHSLIILDNAKYHNTVVEKVPTKSSRKEDMRQWLTRHGIPFNPNDLKRDLLCLIKASNIRTKYKTDVIAEKFGHEVVRLPVAHCELNHNDSDLSDDKYDRQLLEQERQKLDEIMHAAY